MMQKFFAKIFASPINLDKLSIDQHSLYICLYLINCIGFRDTINTQLLIMYLGMYRTARVSRFVAHTKDNAELEIYISTIKFGSIHQISILRSYNDHLEHCGSSYEFGTIENTMFIERLCLYYKQIHVCCQ